MRRTVTLDPDTEQIVRRHMRERGMSFEEAVNDAIRSGVRAGIETTPFRTTTVAMGQPRISLNRALQLAGDLEDGELARRHRSGDARGLS